MRLPGGTEPGPRRLRVRRNDEYRAVAHASLSERKRLPAQLPAGARGSRRGRRATLAACGLLATLTAACSSDDGPATAAESSGATTGDGADSTTTAPPDRPAGSRPGGAYDPGSTPIATAYLGSLAQLAEHRAFNPQVQGSSPWRPTK